MHEDARVFVESHCAQGSLRMPVGISSWCLAWLLDLARVRRTALTRGVLVELHVTAPTVLSAFIRARIGKSDASYNRMLLQCAGSAPRPHQGHTQARQ